MDTTRQEIVCVCVCVCVRRGDDAKEVRLNYSGKSDSVVGLLSGSWPFHHAMVLVIPPCHGPSRSTMPWS